MKRHVLCALDTADPEIALGHVRRLKDHVGGFKIGHALTLSRGLEVISMLQDAGARRVFLDLKFHDIPSVVGLAVREATRRGVWMLTVHAAGGRAMMQAAAEEAGAVAEEDRPCVVAVTVLTSLDEDALRSDLAIGRTVEEHMLSLSRLAMDNEMDGVVCSPREVAPLRRALGSKAILVTPGIRPADSALGDQARTGDPVTALLDGADYLVMGRALLTHADPARLLGEIAAGAPHAA